MSTLAHDTDAQMKRRVVDLERTVVALQSQHKESLRLLHDEIGRLQRACAADQLSELLSVDRQQHRQVEIATQTKEHESPLPILTTTVQHLINAETASTSALSSLASQSAQTTAQCATLFQQLSGQVKERDMVIVHLENSLTERDNQLEAMRAIVSKNMVELDAVKQRLATSEAFSSQVKHQLAALTSADPEATAMVPRVRESPRRVVQVEDGPDSVLTTGHRPRSQLANVVDTDNIQENAGSSPTRRRSRPPSAPLPESTLPQRPSMPPPATTTTVHHRQLATSSSHAHRPRSVANGTAAELSAKQAAIIPLLQSITAGRSSSNSQLSTSSSSPIPLSRSRQHFSAVGAAARVDSMMTLEPSAEHEFLGTHQAGGISLNKTAMLPPIGMSVGVTAAVGGSDDAGHHVS